MNNLNGHDTNLQKGSELERFNSRIENRPPTTIVRMSSYFDGDEESALVDPEKNFRFHKEEVFFSFSVYIEVLAIHMLSFGILGPLINIYPLLICKNWYYMKNLQFFHFSPMGIQ